MHRTIWLTESEVDQIQGHLELRLSHLRAAQERLEKEALGNIDQTESVHALASSIDDPEILGIDRTVKLEMIERFNREISEITDAQERLVAGTFGKCKICKRQVPVRRLIAMPESQTCGPCKEDLEREQALHRHVAQLNRQGEMYNRT